MMGYCPRCQKLKRVEPSGRYVYQTFFHAHSGVPCTGGEIR